MQGLALLNAVIPGAGLVMRDRLAIGLSLLVIALLAVAMVVAGWVLGTPAFAGRISLAAAAGYAVVALLAVVVWWVWERGGPVDAQLLKRGHDEIAAAYLRGDYTLALTAARRLVASAPRHAGCWRLLALVAQGAGITAESERAGQRAERIERLNR